MQRDREGTVERFRNLKMVRSFSNLVLKKRCRLILAQSLEKKGDDGLIGWHSMDLSFLGSILEIFFLVMNTIKGYSYRIMLARKRTLKAFF